MSTPASKLPPELHESVNRFLSTANELHKAHPYDAVSASILYAAARYNVHGFVHQDSPSQREDFLDYMVDLYRRMLIEQLDLQLADAASAKA